MHLAETIVFWLSVIGYAAAFALFLIAVVYRGTRSLSSAQLAIIIAFVLHSTALILRWSQTGHPPFVEFFESVSASAWFGVLIYLGLRAQRNEFRTAGLFVAGTVFLLLGWASTPSHTGGPLSASLQSTWLFIHASFATAAVGCFIAAAGIGLTFLWRTREDDTDDGDTARGERKDEAVFRLVLVGFLFYGIMIVSGAIWADQAWGRYWAWDPIETWSLITWLVYGVFIHLHLTVRNARGRFTMWYALLAVLFAAFSLWGVGYVYETIHTYG